MQVLDSQDASAPAAVPLRRSRVRTALGFAASRLGHSPWLLTLALGIVVILVGRLGPDWPAQEFRSWLAQHDGLTAWDDQWYGGHALPGYSLLFPPITRVLGAGLTGLFSTVACAWLVGRLLPGDDLAHRAFRAASAVALVGNLFIGQVPFLLGLAFGLAACVTLRSNRSWVWTALLALLCSFGSPLAGMFLLMAGLAWLFELGWRRTLPLAAAGGGSLVSSITGGEGGRFPMPWTSLVGVLGFCAVALVLAPRSMSLLRRFAWLYALAAILFFIVPNPVGGNITRLGKLIAIPAAAYLIVRLRPFRIFRDHRRWLALAAAVVIPAVAWQFVPVSTAVAHAASDPSTKPAYYTGLLNFLATQDPQDGRLEVPFTREHWEAAMVAPYYPLARGWERQVDLQYDSVLYSPLTPAIYQKWLESADVDLIALPNAPLDYGGRAEAALLANPPSYLKLVWSDANWKVWKVVGAQPIATGPAQLVDMDPASFSLYFETPGTEVVRIRSSRLWHVSDGTACVEPTSTGWIDVHSSTAGLVELKASLTLANLTSTDGDCSTDTSTS